MDEVEKIKRDVGLRAQAIRKRMGFENRESFAEVLGVHNNTVGFLERGETWLSPEMAILYRDKLGIDPAEFLTEKPVIIQPTPLQALELITKIVTSSVSTLPVQDPLAGLNQENRAVIKKHIDAAKARQLLDTVKGKEDKA
jgi:transcriptional regulator with XRE-family HTH domain